MIIRELRGITRISNDFGTYSRFADVIPMNMAMPGINGAISKGAAEDAEHKRPGFSNAWQQAKVISNNADKLANEPEAQWAKSESNRIQAILLKAIYDIDWNWQHDNIFHNDGGKTAARNNAINVAWDTMSGGYPAVQSYVDAANQQILNRQQRERDAALAVQQAAAAAQIAASTAQASQSAVTVEQAHSDASAANLTVLKNTEAAVTSQLDINKLISTANTTTVFGIPVETLALGIAAIGGGYLIYRQVKKKSAPMNGYRRRKHRR